MKKNLIILIFLSAAGSFLFAQTGKFMKNDLHQHTTFSDGTYSLSTMMYMSNKYGLDFWANCDHGGSSARDGFGPLWTTPPFTKDTAWNEAGDSKWWDSYNPNPIKGSILFGKNKHQRMWRWQSIKEYCFPQLVIVRKKYEPKIILQSLEWNMPGHEHVAVTILSKQFCGKPNSDALAEFEYKFDSADNDSLGGNEFGWTKDMKHDHKKSIDALKWLRTNYPYDSYALLNHPERRKRYTASDIREFNDAAPDIIFGHEAIPGHQKYEIKCDYQKGKTEGDCTYGGTGIYLSKIGGLWDALLSEGRHWWVFTNSDCHSVGKANDMSDGEDFWPGEFAKNHTFVKSENNPEEIISGLRSGNTWIVTGDLIDSLDFRINNSVMGSTAMPINGEITIKILARDPQSNNHNTYSDYRNPILDHIDLIAGEIYEKYKPGTPEYSITENRSTKVIARFDACGNSIDSKGLVSKKWIEKPNGIKEITFTIENISKNMYFRLRGTNHKLDTENETDGEGNPLPDDLVKNSAANSFADLWFYSNPVFIKIQ